MKSADWRPLWILIPSLLLLAGCENARSEVGVDDRPSGPISTSSLVLQQEIPVVASVARRCAEAADGFRTGELTFFVAQEDYPYRMEGPFASRAAAEDFRVELGEGYVVCGPFLVGPDFGRTAEAVVVPCKKKNSSWCTRLAPPDAYAAESVAQMAVSVILVNGDTVVYSFSPDEVEAFFFTVSAIDRFVIPYYTRLYGQEWVDEFSDSLQAGIERSIP